MKTKSTPVPTAHPPIATAAQWRARRVALLKKEKQLTRAHDRLSAERRRMPMVKVEKDYVFDGPKGRRTLKQLFEGKKQLIVYHFMFDPAWDKGCPGCTGFVEALGDLSMLGERHTTFALISRAPSAKLEKYKKKQGWTVPWYSSFGTTFNWDFHVTFDTAVVPFEYNFKRNPKRKFKGEGHGLSVFFLHDGDVYHTYSTYARGVESLTDAYPLLDVTPYGRQEDWEDSPKGWPQKPTYGG